MDDAVQKLEKLGIVSRVRFTSISSCPRLLLSKRIFPFSFQGRILMQLHDTSPSQDDSGRYSCVDLKQANEIIGITTEEVVLKATEGEEFTENNLPCPPTE